MGHHPTRRNGEMRRAASYVLMFSFLVAILATGLTVRSETLEEGTVTGKIERVNEKFERDYNSLGYKDQKEWQAWGKDLKSLGWVVVQGDSGEPKDYLLLVIDTRSKLAKEDGTQAAFSDLNVGSRITASYKMGWDALHAAEVKLLKAQSAP
jgi:hypothetical protein